MWSRNENSQRQDEGTTDQSVTDSGEQDTVLFSNEGPDGQVMASIARGMEFKGCLRYSGTVRIDGKMEGEIITDGTVLVGRGAVIFAQVHARKVLCLGQITGDIVATEKIRLLSPAVINGSINTPVLAMEEGVLCSGTLEMRQAEQAQTTSRVSSAPARSLPSRESLALAHGNGQRTVGVS